jgi:hypothetical protein
MSRRDITYILRGQEDEMQIRNTIMHSVRPWQLSEIYDAVIAVPCAVRLAHRLTMLKLDPYYFTMIEISKKQVI